MLWSFLVSNSFFSSVRRRVLSLAAAATLLATGVIATSPGGESSPTVSAASDGYVCPDGWLPVGDAECELLVRASGDITLPDGVEHVDALVVGGGGGGGGANLNDVPPGQGFKLYAGGGGGSGEVIVCTGVEISGTVSVEIGDGGAGGAGAIDPATSEDGDDGGASSIGDCTAAGGFGGEADSDPTVAGGTGGASGAGFDGGRVTAAGQGGGGGGATAGGDDGWFGGGGSGGRALSVDRGCFSDSGISLGMGGGGGSTLLGKGGLNFSWDWDLRNAGSGASARQHRWDGSAQDWVQVSGVTLRDSGDGASATGNQNFVKYPAGNGGANSGSGGGGGVSWQAMLYSDGNTYPGKYYPGGAGGSGVVVLRYSTAGDPTIGSARASADPDSDGQIVTVDMTEMSCEVFSMTIDDVECPEITMPRERAVQCALPAGNYVGALVTIRDGGGTASALIRGDSGGGGGGGGGFVPIAAVRSVDTRATSGGEGPIAGGSVLELDLSDVIDLERATAAVIHITAVDDVGTVPDDGRVGYITAYPCDQDRPKISNVNYIAGDASSNTAITRFGDDGRVCLFVSDAVNVLVDITGWFSAGYVGIEPTRLLETRGPGGIGQPIAADTVTRIQTGGENEIPTDAVGVVMNVTAVNPLAAGFLTVWDCSDVRRDTSSVNFAPISPFWAVPNLSINGLSDSGEICVHNSATTDVLVDAFGWFDDTFTPVTHTRLLDTRNADPLVADEMVRVQITGRGGVPTDALSVAVNLTAVDATEPGFATVYTCEDPHPGVSKINFLASETVANTTFIGLDDEGGLCVYTSGGADFLMDVFGWFTTEVVRN